MIRQLLAASILAIAVAPPAAATEAAEPLGIGLEGVRYPYPVRYLPLTMDGQTVQMAYMDVRPAGEGNGRAALLLHGRNFSGDYWQETVAFLASAGWRVIVPDQVGFGKSSKPDLPLSFHWLAHNTRELLDYLRVGRADVIAHSMGGMLAARFALMYPDRVDRLVLEGPIGLEDYRLAVPYATRDELIEESRAQTREGIERFYRGYFVNWEPRFQRYADTAWRWLLGPEAERLHRIAATTYAMAYEQPVVYELERIARPTLIVVGDRDRSAIGRGRASPEARERLGNFPELARRTAERMPNCLPVVLNRVGHIPHLEVPEQFHAVLFSFLALPPGAVLDSRASPGSAGGIKIASP